MNRIIAVVFTLTFTLAINAAEPYPSQAYRKDKQPVAPPPTGPIVCEAEEFQVTRPGWEAKPWGTNYFAATFANSFLSRKAYLGAPEQADRTEATITVKVPKAGKYLALVRYESVYRFETQFRLKIEQKSRAILDRLYGARDNLKIWAFKEGLKKELAWSWGAVENIVWEGHDAEVDLEAGEATLTLIADKQAGNAARRNVDAVVLTDDLAGVKNRLAKENYLPLDGLMTQSGDVFLKLHNAPGSAAMTLTVPNGTEHSPYWIHIRDWKPKTVTAEPGQSSDWVEVGSLLDSLNDGQWTLTGKATKGGKLTFAVEFGVADASGKIESIKKFDNLTTDLTLAYDADTRWTRRIRLDEEILYDLIAYLKKNLVDGVAPKRTLIYGYTFTPKAGNEKYNAAIAAFTKLMGATALRDDMEKSDTLNGLIRGYTDMRGVPTPKLEEHCKKLEADGKAKTFAVVSLGDEIGLGVPPATDHAGFRAWLKTQNLKPSDIDPNATDIDKINYSPAPETTKTNPGLYYWSKIYSYRFGIKQLKERTDIIKKYLPNAGIGANFSPHHKHLYMGDTHHWISIFREDGMTMPWGEDYIWQVPVGTQQMNFLMVDMFRSGIKDKPDRKIHYYAMPHTPGNTTANWRRQFYGDLAHGAKVLNLFEFRPVQVAYTENHCSDPAMFQEVRRSLHELGRFEDIIQDGQVQPGVAGLWFSEAADVWDDNNAPFDAAKRCLYIGIRHQQLPLDIVIEGDDLSSYKVLYLTDRHVSRKATKAIADWANAGGHLLATAGAGMFDEFNQPNKAMQDLLGVTPKDLEFSTDVVQREKEDLPFAKPMDTVTLVTNAAEIKAPVIGARGKFDVKGADVAVQGKFDDGSPAFTVRVSGKGKMSYCGFLPGLSYFKSAIPLRPVDRGATEDTMAHFIPTEFDRASTMIIGTPAGDVSRPVVCSNNLVETTVIRAKQGVAIPLVNWSDKPVKGLTVTVNMDIPAKAELASGKAVKASGEGKTPTFTLDLDVADVLVLR